MARTRPEAAPCSFCDGDASAHAPECPARTDRVVMCSFCLNAEADGHADDCANTTGEMRQLCPFCLASPPDHEPDCDREGR